MSGERRQGVGVEGKSERGESMTEHDRGSRVMRRVKVTGAQERNDHCSRRGFTNNSNSNSIPVIMIVRRRNFMPQQASFVEPPWDAGGWGGMVLKSVLRPSGFGYGNNWLHANYL